MKQLIENGRAALGIEFGSTRIKAVLVDEEGNPIASGAHDWENQLQDGIWTYALPAVWQGLRQCYADLRENVWQAYGARIASLAAIGISGMMHGYMAFDAAGEQLVPFRTWRNTITEQAAKELTELFAYQIPQRWSIAHLYQAILKDEPHVKDIRFLTTLAGYVHWQLTGERVMGVGEASGMFPIDAATHDYDGRMLECFETRVTPYAFDWKLREILPQVLVAGEQAGTLTAQGAQMLDDSGALQAGIPFCPPEGDAGTGMVATNSVAVRTGNVSAGTSVFAMVVLERELSRVYPEIDLVTTPSGDPVAMVHCNNCTSDLNAWVNLFGEFAQACAQPISAEDLYGMLYRKALEADEDCGGLLAYNYFSGEHITGFEEGRPLLVRMPDSRFTLANLMRAHMFTALGALKLGMDLLLKKEGVQLDILLGHGGWFKTKEVGQQMMASAMGTSVAVMETAGEGGAWGIALLARYLADQSGEPLETFLSRGIFARQSRHVVQPEERISASFEQFMRGYEAGMPIERAAVQTVWQGEA